MSTLCKLIPVVVLCLFCNLIKAQADSTQLQSADSAAKEKAKRKAMYSGPRKASILSAILPGAGQVYNKKYWKLPIIYAGLGGFGYLFYTNNSEYNNYRQAVRAAYDDDPATTYDTRYSPDDLQALKLYYRKYRDIAIFGLGAIYLLNIVDANVDAHLKTFDVSDNLSMRVSPWYSPGTSRTQALGVSVKLNFR